MMVTLVDSHCHLDYIEAGIHGHAPGTCLNAVLSRAQAHGVQWLINPSVTPAEFDRVQSVAERFPNVYFALAIHPTDVQDAPDVSAGIADIRQRLTHPKVVALGETGLDYYRTDPQQTEQQHAWFAATLKLACEVGLPVIVHDRDAHADVAAHVDAVPGVQGVMHCFGGDAAFALAMVERGFYISFAGNVTFKKADALREAARVVPLDRLLVETDSPFLSPVPERGKPNEPYRTRYVAECLAELRGMSLAALAQATTQNAATLFRLPVAAA